MGRPTKQYPSPGKRCRNGRWRIYWRSGDSTYEFSVGNLSETEAENRRIQVELALRNGEWPVWARETSAVRRYCSVDTSGDLLGLYEKPLRQEVSEDWATPSLAYVRELREWSADGLANVDEAEAQGFLEHVLETPPPTRGKNMDDSERDPRTRATRNRMLSACRRFYDWAVRAGHVASNPFSDISQVKEPTRGEIVYCTREEREKILKVAGRGARAMSVWVAFYAGMRRSEIWRARWEHVSIDRQRISVPTTKTNRPRVVPLAAELLKVMSEHQRDSGYVVPRETTWRQAARMVKKDLREAVDVPDDRVRWNAWRHTFGSLLAQEGVSLDKISSWMGNSPDICRRHYARFVPRDRHDEDIEKLG